MRFNVVADDHALYLVLVGEPQKEVGKNYCQSFEYQAEVKLVQDVRVAISQVIVLGNEQFIAEIES